MKKYSYARSQSRFISGLIIFALLCPTLPSSFFTMASAAQHATLQTVVVVVGGTAAPADFLVTTTGEKVIPNSFQGDALGRTQDIPANSFYAVDVGHVAHYKTTLSPECVGELGVGVTATCTITNIFSSAAGATLDVMTHVINTHGGTKTPEDFTIDIQGANATPASFSGSATGQSASVTPLQQFVVMVNNGTGYIAAASSGCAGHIPEGDIASCHLVLRDIAAAASPGSTTTPSASATSTSPTTTPPTNATSSTATATTTPPAAETETATTTSAATTTAATTTVTTTPAPTPAPAPAPTPTPTPTPAAPANLIANAQLEMVDGADSSRPMGWQQGAPWGTNIATYTYPVAVSENPSDNAGASGNAVSVTFASYVGDTLTGGDGKWYPDLVPVTPGSRYEYKDTYRSDTTTYLVAAFFDGSRMHLSNVGHFPVPSTAGVWSSASASFVAPPGSAFMLVYHQLNSVGTLTIDNIVLSDVSSQSKFDRGIVSLVFDDGWRSQYENARSILNAAGIKATFFAVSHNSGFGILNPSFETQETGNAGKPLGWSNTGGTHSTHTYPAIGRSGRSAELTSMATDAGSGWRSLPVTILPDQSLEFSHYYKSTGQSTLYIEVTNTDGSLAHIQPDGDLGASVTPFATLPPAADWTLYKSPETWVPPTVKSISVRYNLVASGTLAIDDVNMGAYHNFMMPAHLRDLENEQHEIGGHSETHADLTGIPLADARAEIAGSRSDLLLGGLAPVLSFAYPLGNKNEAIQAEVAAAGYTSARGTVPGSNSKNENKLALKSHMVMIDTPMSQLEQWINEAVADREWLILTFHQILPEGAPGSGIYTTTPSRLSSIVQYLTQNNILVRTVSGGVALMNDQGNTTTATSTSATTTPASTNATTTSATTATTTTATSTATSTASAATTTAITTSTSATSTATTTTTVITPSPALAPTPAPTPSPAGGGGTGGFTYWGCTIPTAVNYNRLANTNDNSCVFPEVLGAATTSTSTNPNAAIRFPKLGMIIGGHPGIPNTGATSTLGSTSTPAMTMTTTTPKQKPPRFKKYLRPGIRGEEVMELQKHLHSVGQYTGPITGYFGNLTFAAVQRFQGMHNIEQVGYVGPKTRAQLNRMDQGGESWVVMSTNPGLSIEKI